MERKLKKLDFFFVTMVKKLRKQLAVGAKMTAGRGRKQEEDFEGFPI